MERIIGFELKSIKRSNKLIKNAAEKPGEYINVPGEYEISQDIIDLGNLSGERIFSLSELKQKFSGKFSNRIYKEIVKILEE